jgi:hypothetical protein
MGGMTSGGSSVPVDRVVAVVATLRDGREQLGSGYLTSGRRVLTAEHCTRDKVTGESTVRLRVIRASDGAEAQVADLVSDHELDVAVLQLADNAPWDPDLPLPPFARVDQSHSGVLDDCAGIGFPLFQRDPDRRTRHTSEFHGTIYQTDERESGRLLMREPLIHPGPVTGPEGDERGEDGPSPWGGLSGALMFYRGSAIGVVVEHHPRQGDSALRAIGFERIAATSTEIRQYLGLSGPDSLPYVSEQAAVRLELAGVRVSEADPRWLGVHTAISVQGVPDDVPTEYVPRDVDTAEFGVRAKVAAAALKGGFVLLVGGSSVGKTRCAVEAVKALLPDWWLVYPSGPAEVAALAQAPSARTVVWLDELQRYLDGEHGLTGGVVRTLLNAPHPAVIIGTLWPEFYTAYTIMPTLGGADPHAREREVLDLADIIRIAPEFSLAEQDRARAAAARDPRLRVALESARYGLTQTLAAAPQLVARWQDAKTASPYAWAVLTAALDAARLGVRAPLSADLLRTAAPGYLTSQQQAEALSNWFEQALAYATDKLHGAVAALSPAGAGMGQVAGYTVADYLIQHAREEHRYDTMPASIWDAVLSHVRDPADTARLADSANRRLLFRYAIPLYRRAADAGDQLAASELARLLTQRGDLDEGEQILRTLAETGDGDAARQLADLLADRGDVYGLRARADAGDGSAAFLLAGLLYGRGDADGLRARADAGDEDAAFLLAGLVAERGDADGLRARADAGDEHAAGMLADLQGLRTAADAGDEDAAGRLADLQGLRAAADAGDEDAAGRLARLNASNQLAWSLAERGDLDRAEQILHPRADAGDEHAAELLARLLADFGDLDELHARADAGDEDAARELAARLADRGDLDELRARADAGDRHATRQLARLLTRRHDLNGAAQLLRARADAGDEDAARQLVRLLADPGGLDELRARADVNLDAARELAELLADRGDLDGLRARADVNLDAARELAELLADPGDLDELRARADAGDGYAAERLARLLARRGDLDELRARVRAGDGYAASPLLGLLITQGRGEEAERLRRFGLNPDGSIAWA